MVIISFKLSLFIPLSLVEGLSILCLKISFTCCSIEFERDDELFATAEYQGVSRFLNFHRLVFGNVPKLAETGMDLFIIHLPFLYCRMGHLFII